MDILVYADWEGLGGPRLMGTLSVTHTKGREVFTFSYKKEWIDGGLAQNIDPDLQFYSGPQYLAARKKNFGLFLDSSPDRWGRVLMDRREAIVARQEQRKPKSLFEEDYLLGVFDEHRMGALRFKLTEEGSFLSDNKNLPSPPWTSLRELEFASFRLENDALKDEETLKWINLLIAPGASLGGARPKASVTDTHKHLWIAKFPSVNDRTDVGGWEMVANQLAIKAGISVAEGMARKFNSKHHTYLNKRFDRTNKGNRLHFASAMTLLGHSDGAEGVSYLQLAEFIMQNGGRVNEDLSQLWRRIVFNIAIKNTDDHLRNHGFMLTPFGWVLSPAYDINPVHYGKGLTLNISETDNSLDFDLARSVAKYFRLTNKQATDIIEEVQKTVRTWRKIAAKYKISNQEQDQMEAAFSLAE
jgi:serine/threonine-protein kinase HipA